MLIIQLILLLLLLVATVGAATNTSEAVVAVKSLPGCATQCGNVMIPFPFGIGDGCYLRPEFNITCNHSTKPPSAQFTQYGLPVTHISLDEGELRIMQEAAVECVDTEGRATYSSSPYLQLTPPYTISHTKNKFYDIGCDTLAMYVGERRHPAPDEDKLIGGYTMVLCHDVLGKALTDSCEGFGCSQASIPSGLQNFTVALAFALMHDASSFLEKYPCSYSFIMEKAMFTFSPNTSFDLLNTSNKLPLIVDWGIEDELCDEESESYACKAEKSKCVNRTIINGPSGYICQCLPGYEGNPYLQDGCIDIDECKASNPCKLGMCINSPPGNYSCVCPKGYINDGTNQLNCIKDAVYHSKITGLLSILLSASVGFLVLFIGISWTYWGIKQRNFIKLRKRYFQQNGGLLLQKQLSKHGSSVEKTRIFTAEELEKATDNYHESKILGEGGYGTVYKGTLQDKRVVAIKKSKIGSPSQSDQFVNEVIVLSQINHRNVVRLLGCCLETETPLLIYEFITNGTLYEHIHLKRSLLSLELRMKIAAETAGALAYLHSSTSMPIIHRDVKAMNILLDDSYTAKVADFGASRLIPIGQTELETLVLGTFGYLDPEYLQTNQLTEKSDVYSFGVVLLELITSKVALSKNRCLASIFISAMEENWLDQILDANIVHDGNFETAKDVAKLAERCLSVKGQERPTMKEVAMELEGMRMMAKHPWEKNSDLISQENANLLRKANTCALDVRVDSGADNMYDNTKIEMSVFHMSMDDKLITL